MASSDHLAQFVAEALRQGRTRPEISEALRGAGWAAPEVAEALGAWAEGGFTPPVPRPRPYVSAREAFLYGLMFCALAATAWHVTRLGFELIDLWVPDPAEVRVGGQSGGIRWSVATLVVVMPLFLFLTARTARAARANEGLRRSAVRKWVGYITLFLSALALLGDLIAVIYAFLSGDLTMRFLAKAVLVAVTSGLIFLYFRGELAEPSDAP